MSDLKTFFENFYEKPNKLTQDAIILKHCVPKQVSRRRSTKKKIFRAKIPNTVLHLQ